MYLNIHQVQEEKKTAIHIFKLVISRIKSTQTIQVSLDISSSTRKKKTTQLYQNSLSLFFIITSSNSFKHICNILSSIRNFLKLPLSIEPKLSKLSYAKTAHNNNVPLSLVEHESIHSPAWPAVKYLQIRRIHSLDPSNSRTAERIYKRGIMLFPLDPVAKRQSGRKRPAGKDRDPTGAEAETGQKAPMIRSLVLNRLGHSIMQRRCLTQPPSKKR